MRDRSKDTISTPTRGILGKIEDGKRFHLPGVSIASACPKCKKRVVQDLTREHYLNYPKMNEPFLHTFHHDDCGQEWTVTLRLTVELHFA